MPSPRNNQDEHVPSQENGKEEHVPSPGKNQDEHVTSQDNGQEEHVSSQANNEDEAVSGQDNGQEKHLPSQENNPRSAQGDSGSVLNCDVLEQIVMLTLAISPAMRASLRAVSTLFKSIVDKVPLPRVYIPELSGHVHRISMKKVIKMKGKNSGAVLELKRIINSNNWSNAWLILVGDSYGWFLIKSIYRKK